MQSLSSSICSYDHGISLSIMTAEYLLKISNLYLHDNIGIPQKIARAFFGNLMELCSFSSEKKDEAGGNAN